MALHNKKDNTYLLNVKNNKLTVIGVDVRHPSQKCFALLCKYEPSNCCWLPMKEHNPRSMPIIQCDANGVVISEFTSKREAERKTGISIKTLSKRIKDNKQHKGYYWHLKHMEGIS